MNHTVRNGFERGNGRYHEQGSPAVCQGLDTYLCDQNSRLYREKKEQHQQGGGKCYLGTRNGADLYDGSIKTATNAIGLWRRGILPTSPLFKSCGWI